jgi:hypothetical protein
VPSRLRDDGEAAYPGPSVLQHDDGARFEVGGDPVEVAQKEGRLALRPSRPFASKEDQGRVASMGLSEQRAEIGVRRQENPAFGRGSLENGQVIGAAQPELR